MTTSKPTSTSWVFDATPLIYLAKAERLDVLETLEESRVVPGAVHREVVTASVEQGTTKLARHPGLSDADVAVLACTDVRDAIAVRDESTGRSAAEVGDIKTRGAAYLVLTAVKDGTLSMTEGRDAIDAMIDHGWYVAPDVYTKIVGKLKSLGE